MSLKSQRVLILSFFLVLSSTLVQAREQVIIADYMFNSQTGELQSNPIITINEGKIRSVVFGEPSSADAVIDLRGYTIMPGLIDMHTHLTSSASAHGYKRLAISPTRAALAGTKHAERTLLSGITTVRNIGAPGFVDIDLRDAINSGDVIGPRMFTSGPSLSITGGHCDNNLLPYHARAKSEGVADGPWEVAKIVRRNIKYGADVIKLCATGGVLSKGTKVGVQQYTYEEMKLAVEEAHRRGKTVAAHAHGTEGIYQAIRAGVDTVEHASFIDERGIKLAKKMGTYLSMDIYVTEYILGEGEKAGISEESLNKERKTGSVQRANFKKAVEAGAKIVFGTDAGVYPHGDNTKQLKRMVEFGMTPAQALQSATSVAASALKKEDLIGSIATGLAADIIAVKGNPLENISIIERVNFVMKDGQIYKRP